MRKLLFFAGAVLLLSPITSQAKTLDELLAEKGIVGGSGAVPGEVSYKGGTRLDFGDHLSIKMKLLIQQLYSYTDFDESSATGRSDTSSFRSRRVRLVFTGDLLDKQFSYKLQNDFASDSGGGDLKDSWLQWNLAKEAKIRMGAHKTPYSRQENSSGGKLQMIDRSNVNARFALGRQNGAMVHGDLGVVNYAAGVYNGFSSGEGNQNSRGVDNNHAGVFAVNANFGDYGSRGYEGDMRDGGGFAGTGGVAFFYDQGEIDGSGDFDGWGLNVDGGLRCSGASLQAEFFMQNIDFDMIPGAAGQRDDTGFYVQGGYRMGELEVAGRYGYVDYDSDNPFSGLDSEQEYSVVLNRFFHGHDVKIQTGFTWDVDDFSAAGSSDLTDMRWDVMLSGYF